MSNIFWNLAKAAPAAVIGASLFANGAAAQQEANTLEQINNYSVEGNSAGQVNSVFELSDVSPGDWAFEALRSLVENYGCIAGYPDGTFRGNQAMTRYEFAAGLNACLESLQFGGLTEEDLETIRALLSQFQAELATLGARVDNLEGRVTFLEENQFSTTTKLNGEVLFVLADVFGDVAGTNDDDIDTEANLGYRVRLNFDTSFTGEDRLRTRLEAREVSGTGSDFTGTNMTRLNLRGSTDDNNVELNLLAYRFPVGDSLTLHVAALGYDIDDVFDPVNPVASSGGGALARFFDRNPLTHRAEAAGVGVGANYAFNDNLSFDVTYQSNDGNDPEEGLFASNYSTGAQANYDFGSGKVALTYLREYTESGDTNLSSSTSDFAGDPFGEVFPGSDTAVTSNNFGLAAAVDLGERVILGGFFGYGLSDAQSGSADGEDVDLITGQANVSFLDLVKEGSILRLAAGVPPKVINASDGDLEQNDGTSVMIEGQYRFPVNDNIEVTPGAYVVLNPEHDNDNSAIVVGTIRTRFSF